LANDLLHVQVIQSWNIGENAEGNEANGRAAWTEGNSNDGTRTGGD
jgi:hypothetical protein